MLVVHEEGELSLEDAMAHAKALHQQGDVRKAAIVYSWVLQQQNDHVDALHFLGVASFQLGKPDVAENLIRAALSYAPNDADAVNNLANVLKSRGKLDEAWNGYARVLELQPENVAALTNVGSLLAAKRDLDGAIALYRRVIALAPEHFEAHHNLGNALMEQGKPLEALEALQTALLLRPYSIESYRTLGAAASASGKRAEAIAIYRKWLELAPDDAEAQHMVAAITGKGAPARASDACVKQLFDRFSGSFDAVLKALDYKAPAIVAGTLAELLGEPRGSLDVLDVGCGTGLGGPLLRPYARTLVGVDLSDGMIQKARERGVYDDFIVSDLAACLAGRPDSCDLITAIDTFCYIGDLEATAKAVKIALRPGGRSIFTVERAEESSAPDGFLLEPHGRYSHTRAYLERVLGDAGLLLEFGREETLRKEAGKDVAGLAVVARRPLT